MSYSSKEWPRQFSQIEVSVIQNKVMGSWSVRVMARDRYRHPSDAYEAWPLLAEGLTEEEARKLAAWAKKVYNT